MKIEKEELVLVPIRETAHCETCGAELGEAVLLPRLGGFECDGQGNWAPVNSPRYLYTCPQCGATEESEIKFPRISYKYKEANKIGFERLFNFQP